MKTPVIEGLTATQLVDKIHAFQALLDELKLEVTQVKLQAGLAQAEAEEASLQAGFAHSAAEEAANLVGELNTKVVEIESAFIKRDEAKAIIKKLWTVMFACQAMVRVRQAVGSLSKMGRYENSCRRRFRGGLIKK